MMNYELDYDNGERLSVLDKEGSEFIEKHFPAVMSVSPGSVGKTYKFISTRRIAEHLEKDHGLQISYIGQQRSNKRDPRFQEHVVRFRMPNNEDKIGDSWPEIVIMNSHNGRCALRICVGVFRMVCSNGMIIADRGMQTAIVRHAGIDDMSAFVDRIIYSATMSIKAHAKRVDEMMETWLDKEAQIELAERMMVHRKFPDWITPEMVLESRRKEDDCTADGSRSMWITFNVIQESIMRGEFEGQTGNRKVRTKKIDSVVSSFSLNESIWEELEMFAMDLTSRG